MPCREVGSDSHRVTQPSTWWPGSSSNLPCSDGVKGCWVCRYGVAGIPGPQGNPFSSAHMESLEVRRGFLSQLMTAGGFPQRAQSLQASVSPTFPLPGGRAEHPLRTSDLRFQKTKPTCRTLSLTPPSPDALL